MGMLDRYKKKGGFVQLLTLIETSGKQKQDQFLNLIKQESPVWEEAIRERCLSFERILSWDHSHLREILSRLQPLTLATAISGLPPEKVDLIMSCMSTTDQRKIRQVLDEAKPTPAEVGTCIHRIVTETRGFLTGRILQVEKIDTTLMIPENIEEQLANQPFVRSVEELTAKIAEAKEAHATEVAASSDPKETGANKEELEFFKKKINQLMNENASLKQEVSVLRSKLDQIRKIA